MSQINFKRLIAAGVIFLLICIVILTMMITGEVGGERPLRMIYIPKIIDENNDFWSSLLAGAQMAAEEYGVELTVMAPESEEDYIRQNELVEWALEQNPDAILLSPANFELTTPAAKKIIEENVKLILVDSAVNEPIQNASVATDNYKAGMNQGILMKKLLKPEGRILIISHVQGASTAMEREQGVRAALGEDADRIAEVAFCDSDYGKAYQLTAKLIKKYGDIVMIAGLNEYSAVGAARAVKEMGLSDSIHMVGFDSSMEEIQLLEEGVFDGIIVQKPFNMGYLGVQQAVRTVRGEAGEDAVDSGSQVITKENMYTEENQMILFPFRD